MVPPARSPCCEQPSVASRDAAISRGGWESGHAPFIVTDHCHMASAMIEDHGTLSRHADLSTTSQQVDHNPYKITEL